jgi:hypothetical protein
MSDHARPRPPIAWASLLAAAALAIAVCMLLASPATAATGRGAKTAGHGIVARHRCTVEPRGRSSKSPRRHGRRAAQACRPGKVSRGHARPKSSRAGHANPAPQVSPPSLDSLQVTPLYGGEEGGGDQEGGGEEEGGEAEGEEEGAAEP